MSNSLWVMAGLGLAALPALGMLFALGLCRAAKTAEHDMTAG